MQTGQKFWSIVRISLATILLCGAFIRPVSSQASPDQPYDLFLPLLTKPYSLLPLIENGDFELGRNGDWTEDSFSGYDLIYQDNVPFALPVTPHSGQWLAWLGGVPEELSDLYQAVSLPSDGPAYLRYYYQVGSDKSMCNVDWMYLKVGATALESRGLCSAANTQDWAMAAVDLSAYAGQTITITFQVTTDSDVIDLSSFFIDDASLVRSP
jgi:hypothetical protein